MTAQDAKGDSWMFISKYNMYFTSSKTQETSRNPVEHKGEWQEEGLKTANFWAWHTHSNQEFIADEAVCTGSDKNGPVTSQSWEGGDVWAPLSGRIDC